jgi:hypothetical protein
LPDHLFTTIATLGARLDITLQELRIESFFPMDEETREAFRKWSSAANGRDGDHRWHCEIAAGS